MISEKIDSEKCLTGYVPAKVHRMPLSSNKKSDKLNSKSYVHELLPSDDKKTDDWNLKSYAHFMLAVLFVTLCLVSLLNSCNGYHDNDYYSDAISISSNAL